MGTFITTLGDHWFAMGIVSVGSVGLFLLFIILLIIWQAVKDCRDNPARYEVDTEDSFYDQTKQELRLENRRLLEDLEEEKKHSNHITTVKNTLLTENAEQKERIGGLCNMIDFKSSEILSYEEELEIKNNSLAALGLEVERLEGFIDMAANDANIEEETTERTAEFYRDYIHGENENNNKKN